MDTKRRRCGQGPGRSKWAQRKVDDAATLPAGPETAEDLGNWPAAVVAGLISCRAEDEEVALRLQSHLLAEIVVYTDYSGMDCPREALQLGFAALQKACGWQHPILAQLKFVRSCDISALAQKVLLELAEQQDGCVFQDMLARLPQTAQLWIESAKPDPDASMESAREAYSVVRQWVFENRDWIFPDDAESWCCRHMKQCPAHPLLQASQSMAAPAVASKASMGQRPLMVNCAGVSCLPWTAEGSQRREASECDIPHSVWVAERSVRANRLQEDICFIECTPRYAFDKMFAQPLETTHHCFRIRVGPELLGWPHRRMRLLGVGLSKLTMEWVGPSTPEAIAQDFAERFHRAVMLSGDVFCMASDSEVKHEYCTLAAKQKNFISTADLEALDPDVLLRLMLPPGGGAALP